MLNRDIRIRNPPKAAVDKMLASPVTRSALERARADMAAAASKVRVPLGADGGGAVENGILLENKPEYNNKNSTC